jgi:hypothetical protein
VQVAGGLSAGARRRAGRRGDAYCVPLTPALWLKCGVARAMPAPWPASAGRSGCPVGATAIQ